MTLYSELRSMDSWRQYTDGKREKLMSELQDAMSQTYLYRGIHNVESFIYPIPTFRHVRSGQEFQLIFGGSFTLGFSDNEKRTFQRLAKRFPISPDVLPVARVVTVEPFFMMRLPVLKSFAKQHLSANIEARPYFGGGNVPAFLSRREVIQLGEQFDLDLPSDVQWEYAYRAGTSTLFPFGDSLPEEGYLEEIMNVDFSDLHYSEGRANGFGILGMQTGEWCRDTFRVPRPTQHSDLAEDSGPPYVIRGGAAFFWPWQGEGWLLCVSAQRSNSEEALDDGMCGVRFQQRLSSLISEP